MRKLLFISILSITALKSFGQQQLKLQLEQRGETVVTFDAEYLKQIPDVYSWSVDKVKDNKAFVYLNAKQYEKLLELNIPFVPEPTPSLISEVKMASSVTDIALWDAYPTYENYVTIMQQFTKDFPGLCRLDTIGLSANGRLLLALKISDNVTEDEDEPEFFYTSSMHGDELTGYVLMLRLADHLLNNYQVTKSNNLIDNLEIYINPLANPDGTYAAGNNTVNGATRYNANGVDLNRNFPDPFGSLHPDGKVWQTETLAMMEFMKKRNFSMSMNFHGGAELLNYPWDTDIRRHPDDSWFNFISREYVDTVHSFDALYMTDLGNGVTNGFDWYVAKGTRQDYVTYFLHGREITAEISRVKLPNASELPAFWDKNYRSLLNYMQQALYGIHGLVTDIYGNPLMAKISVLDHDKDSSQVWTQSGGVFYRYLKEGIYDLNIEAAGFISKTLYNVEVIDFAITPIAIQLEVGTSLSSKDLVEFIIFPNPANNIVNIVFPNSKVYVGELQLISIDGKIIVSKTIDSADPITLDLGNSQNGLYFVKLNTVNGSKSKKLLVY